MRDIDLIRVLFGRVPPSDPSEERILKVSNISRGSEKYQLLTDIIFKRGIKSDEEIPADVKYFNYVPVMVDDGLGVVFKYSLGSVYGGHTYKGKMGNVESKTDLAGAGILYKGGGASLVLITDYDKTVIGGSPCSWKEKRENPNFSFITDKEYQALKKMLKMEGSG